MPAQLGCAAVREAVAQGDLGAYDASFPYFSARMYNDPYAAVGKTYMTVYLGTPRNVGGACQHHQFLKEFPRFRKAVAITPLRGMQQLTQHTPVSYKRAKCVPPLRGNER